MDRYNGYLETAGPNRGPIIDRWNRRYKAPLGAPYCATSSSSFLDSLTAEVPAQRTAWARAFGNNDGVDAIDVWKGKAQIPLPCVIVHHRRSGGHVSVGYDTVRVNGRLFVKVWEANSTKRGQIGSEWNGDWTGYNDREIKVLCSPYNAFRAVKFVKIR